MLDTTITSIAFTNDEDEVLGIITEEGEIIEKDGFKISINRKEATD